MTRWARARVCALMSPHTSSSSLISRKRSATVLWVRALALIMGGISPGVVTLTWKIRPSLASRIYTEFVTPPAPLSHFVYGFEQAPLKGGAGSRGPAVDVELAVDRPQVIVDRLGAEHQAIGDLGVG